MKNVKVLDCTLRDGGRLIDCKFSDYEVSEICRRLAKSNIDVVEVGFIRDWRKVNYVGNSTFFTDPSQISKYLPKNTNTTFVAFIDYGMCDFDRLPDYDGTSVTGFRVGFTRKNFLQDREGVERVLKLVKDKGYKLFIQGVNTLGYSEDELKEVLKMINEVHPYSFGIVDTYGAMYPEDFERIFSLVDSNLDKDIALDFHAHNNRQMAFALSQQCIRACDGKRELIVDGTLNGMGKCAGNLNLELIVDYLNTHGYNYDFDEILDMIDEFVRPIGEKCSWGYSVPALMGGIYKSHPNNIIYLFNKFRLESKDFKNIISMIDPELRQRYDYDNLEKLYYEYSNTKIDDDAAMAELSKRYAGKDVLLLSPGSSLNTYSDKIESYIEENKPEIITVSFYREGCPCFCGNKRRYDKILSDHDADFILTSNVTTDTSKGIIVNYNSLVDRRYVYFDNSVMMALNLLAKLKVRSIKLAGFDGYSKDMKNFIDDSFNNDRQAAELDRINNGISTMVHDYEKRVGPQISVTFLTPSKYE